MRTPTNTCLDCGQPTDVVHGSPEAPGPCPDPRVAWDRPETDPCQRGTVGCSTNHELAEECHPW